jgi:hypothetical protein
VSISDSTHPYQHRNTGSSDEEHREEGPSDWVANSPIFWLNRLDRSFVSHARPGSFDPLTSLSGLLEPAIHRAIFPDAAGVR